MNDLSVYFRDAEQDNGWMICQYLLVSSVFWSYQEQFSVQLSPS